MNNHYGHCHIYVSYERDPLVLCYYVRIASLETARFPHGIALAPSFTDREEAVEYAKSVNSYLNKSFTCYSCIKKKQDKKLKSRRAERKAKIQNEIAGQV